MKYITLSILLAISILSVDAKKITKTSVYNYMMQVADYQIRTFDQLPKDGQNHPQAWTGGVLYRGMAEWAKMAKDPKYLNFLEDCGQSFQWKFLGGPYNADNVCLGQMYLELYRLNHKSEILANTLAFIDPVIEKPSNADLGKLSYSRWSWCDALFMAPPVYAAAYQITGDRRYLDFMNKEFKVTVDFLFDKSEGFFYRDHTFFNKRENNGEKVFWGRGNGWVFAGLCLLMNNLTPGTPEYDYYLSIYKQMAPSVIKCQDKKGSWHPGLLDPAAYPMAENSASALYTYGLAWGVNRGLLPEKCYRKAADRGWKALTSYVEEDGRLGNVQPIGVGPRSVDRESSAVYGVGAFLLAGSEMYQMCR